MSDSINNQPASSNQPTPSGQPAQPQQPDMPTPVPGAFSFPAPVKPAETWLVAAWPGMGNVAVLAAGYLVNTLGLKPIGEMVVRSAGIGPTAPRGNAPALNISDVFDVEHVQVKDGVVIPPRLPRNLLFQSQQPINGRNLIVFIGEAQPSSGNYAFAHALLDKAQQLGASRVLTFASMASELQAAQQPQVFGVATEPTLLDQLKRAEVTPLSDGQITGLNGVLLGAALERHMPGVCLLGEIPGFAAPIANPRAAKGVLDSFSVMTSIDLDFKPLDSHIAKVDRLLLKLQDRIEQREGDGAEGAAPIDLNELVREVELESFEVPEADTPQASGHRPLTVIDRKQIEAVFAMVQKDRSRISELKSLLDRLGAFKEYENRFLDLFRKAD